MTADYKAIACPYGSCAAQAGELCQEWSQMLQRMNRTAWPHQSRLRLADSRHIEALENVVRDLIGWNPNSFPPEVIANAKALVSNQVEHDSTVCTASVREAAYAHAHECPRRIKVGHED